MEVDAPDVSGLYRRFAEIEARGSSPTYERLCLAVAGHAGVLGMLETLPRGKRQPNLLLGALRLLGTDVGDPTAALAFAVEHADRVLEVMRSHATQTNEPARCAVMLPALARVRGPVALLEVGASAGLCLLYDRYRYVYSAGAGERSAVREIGDGELVLSCAVAGVGDADGSDLIPGRVPEILGRLGLDPNPLDAGDPEVARWLQCLVWPEHTDRAERLEIALALAATDPPEVVKGLAPAALPELVGRLRAAHPEATVVVLHSAAIAYLDVDDRIAFARTCRDLQVRRVGLEGVPVAADLGADVPDGVPRGRFVLTLDDDVLAHAHPHGRDLVAL